MSNNRCLLLPSNFPKIVCLIGSSKFKEQFLQIANELELQGNLVLMMTFNNYNYQTNLDQDIILRSVDRARIYIADLVIVVNVDGYIGQDTKQEIDYAMHLGREIKFYYPM
jgi:hypothetical protein